LGFGDAAAGRLASGCWRAGGAQTLSRRPLVMAEMAIRSELARTQTRTNSLIIVDSLDVVHQQSKKLRNDGASATTFFFGVCNVAFSAFIAGRMPEYYWVWNTLKMFFFFPLRIKRQLEQGSIGQQIEICWLSNVLIVGMLTIAFVDEYVTNEMLPPEMLRRGFLFFFMLAAGPLGWSIVVLGNSLLFHSIDHTATLIIHSGPLVSVWSLLGASPSAVSAAFPAIGVMLEGLRASPPTPIEFLAPVCIFYGIWWLPYTLWLACSLDARKADEVRAAPFVTTLEPLVHRIVGCLCCGESTRTLLFFYCIVHAGSCLTSFACALLLFRYYLLFSVWGLSLLLAAAWKGASQYNYYLVDAYTRKLEKVVQQGKAPMSNMEALETIRLEVAAEDRNSGMAMV